MIDEEVNRTIAEFMGFKYYPTNSPSPSYLKNNVEYKEYEMVKYTKSLNALVPVWEKLGTSCFYFLSINYNSEFICDFKCQSSDKAARGKTIQQAAAHATAKAIMDLKNE